MYSLEYVTIEVQRLERAIKNEQEHCMMLQKNMGCTKNEIANIKDKIQQRKNKEVDMSNKVKRLYDSIRATRSSELMVEELRCDLLKQCQIEDIKISEDKKRLETIVIKYQRKWEEYLKIYKTFPLYKELQNLEIIIRQNEISFLRHLTHASEFKFKLSEIKSIRQKQTNTEVLKFITLLNRLGKNIAERKMLQNEIDHLNDTNSNLLKRRKEKYEEAKKKRMAEETTGINFKRRKFTFQQPNFDFCQIDLSSLEVLSPKVTNKDTSNTGIASVNISPFNLLSSITNEYSLEKSSHCNTNDSSNEITAVSVENSHVTTKEGNKQMFSKDINENDEVPVVEKATNDVSKDRDLSLNKTNIEPTRVNEEESICILDETVNNHTENSTTVSSTQNETGDSIVHVIESSNCEEEVLVSRNTTQTPVESNQGNQCNNLRNDSGYLSFTEQPSEAPSDHTKETSLTSDVLTETANKGNPEQNEGNFVERESVSHEDNTENIQENNVLSQESSNYFTPPSEVPNNSRTNYSEQNVSVISPHQSYEEQYASPLGENDANDILSPEETSNQSLTMDQFVLSPVVATEEPFWISPVADDNQQQSFGFPSFSFGTSQPSSSFGFTFSSGFSSGDTEKRPDQSGGFSLFGKSGTMF